MGSRLSAAMTGKWSKARKGEHARGTIPQRDHAGLVSKAVLDGPNGGGGLPAFDVSWDWRICPLRKGKPERRRFGSLKWDFFRYPIRFFLLLFFV